MQISKQFLLRKVLPVVGGAILGFTYYYYIGCLNGHCLIQSNPYLSTAYGGLLGLLFAFPSGAKLKKTQKDD